MVQSLTYTKLRIALETWDAVRQIENYHVVAGSMMYRKFFEKCPEAKTSLRWVHHGMDPDSPHLDQDPVFVEQATLYMKVLDEVVDTLGPNTDMLTDILEDLGERHWKQHNVSAEMYVPLGESLWHVLDQLLPPTVFTPQHRQVWREIWADVANDMTRRELGQRRALRDDALWKKLHARLLAKVQMDEFLRYTPVRLAGWDSFDESS